MGEKKAEKNKDLTLDKEEFPSHQEMGKGSMCAVGGHKI